MGMRDIKTEVKFGATIATDKEQIKLAKTHDFLQYQKDKMAADLGRKIAEEKGWYDHPMGDMVVSDIRLYVFTPNELTDYMDAVFKSKLRHMAATEEYLTDEQRMALMIQSERF